MCNGCGSKFTKREDFDSHVYHNQHEFFYKQVSAGIECLICNSIFPTWNHFALHWRFDKSHDNIALERYRFKKKTEAKDEWVTRPIHKFLVNRHIKFDKDKWPLKKNIDRTYLIPQSLKFGFEWDEYNVIEILGPPGHGKSVVGLYLAVWLQIQGWKLYKRVPRIETSFSFGETRQFVSEMTRGDTIIQDEDPEAAGTGKIWAKDAIENLMKTQRAEGIHYIFISPTNVKYLWNQQFILEAYARNFARRINKMALYDAEKHALGWSYLPILDADDPVMIDYLKKKMANIKRIKTTGGLYTIDRAQSKIESDILKLYDWIAANPMFPSSYIRDMTISEIAGWASQAIVGDTQYLTNISKLVKQKIENPQYPVRALGDIDNSVYIGVDLGTGEEAVQSLAIPPDDLRVKTVNFNPVMKGTDTRLLEAIYRYAEPRTEQEKLGHLWWKYRVMQGMLQEGAAEACNEEAKVQKTRIAYLNTFFPAFDKAEHCLGLGAERAIQELYFPTLTYVGGQGKPDLIGEDFLVEIKARPINDQRRVAAILRQADNKYLKKHFQNEDPVKIVLVKYGLKECIVEIYDAEYDS